MPSELLIALAIAFAFVAGMNDGGALLAPGLRLPSLSTAASLGILTAATVAVPMLVLTRVAETLASSIVPDAPGATTALAVGFVAAVAVVVVLTRAGLPTSLTLAVIGGIAGAGLGVGIVVDWGSLLRVLAIGLAAPLVGAGLAMLGSRLWRMVRRADHLATVRWAHVTAFTAQCAAYGANDGQKTLVLFAAAGAWHGGAGPSWIYAVIAAGFALGAVAGLPKVARTIGNGILKARPDHAVTAESSAAIAVLGSAALGGPVSMTQALAGGLLGAGLHDSIRRIRWHVVRNLALTWVVTLPAGFALAALIGFAINAAGW